MTVVSTGAVVRIPATRHMAPSMGRVRDAPWLRCRQRMRGILRHWGHPSPYSAGLNLNVKVLDFVQFGGPIRR